MTLCLQLIVCHWVTKHECELYTNDCEYYSTHLRTLQILVATEFLDGLK